MQGPSRVQSNASLVLESPPTPSAPRTDHSLAFEAFSHECALNDSPESRARLVEAARASENATKAMALLVKRANSLRDSLRSADRERAAVQSAMRGLVELFDEHTSTRLAMETLCEALEESAQMGATESEQLSSLLIEPLMPLGEDALAMRRELKSLVKLRSSAESLGDRVAAGERKDALTAKEQPRHDEYVGQLKEARLGYRKGLLDYVDAVHGRQRLLRRRTRQQTTAWWTARLGAARAQTATLAAVDGRLQQQEEQREEDEAEGGINGAVVPGCGRRELETSGHWVGQQVGHGRHVQGWMWQRSPGKLGQWNRRFFRASEGRLRVVGEDGGPCMDLMTAMVKQLPGESDRQNCFLVVGPHDELLLQAPSTHERTVWVRTLEAETVRLLNEATLSSGALHSRGEQRAGGEGPLAELREADVHNALCCDCGAGGPEWAAINLGVIFCLQCSGIHRSLGVHLSKVRSFRLDSWSEGELAVMAALGNYRVSQQLLEAVRPPNQRLGPDASTAEREQFITLKYQARAWLAPHPAGAADQEGVDKALLSAVLNTQELPQVLLLLLHGARSDVVQDDQFPLLAAAGSGDLACLELLLLHGAPVDQQAPESGWTALHAAAHGGHVQAVSALFKRGARPDALTKKDDGEGLTPAQLAAENGNADCVTLLRLQLLSLTDELNSNDDSLSFAKTLEDFSRNLLEKRSAAE